jgi:homoserine kinase type II
MPDPAAVGLPHPDALAGFGLVPARIEPLTAGGVNRHWRVRSGGATYVLRRYNPRHDPAGTAYEHQALAFLAALAWPVAAPLPAPDGTTVLHAPDGRYALFPFLPGAPAAHGDRDILRLKGRTLARLHQDLAGWPIAGQRPGWGRVADLDAAVQPDGHASLDALLSVVAAGHPVGAAALRMERAANLAELSRLGHDGLPDIVVHFEFYGANLLFEGGALSGLLDFDFIHRDTRVADIGRSLIIDGSQRAPGRFLDAAVVCAWVEGYASHTPLTEQERRLIVPLARANLLWLVAVPLSIWTVTGDAMLLRSALHTLHHDLPALRAQEDAITTMLLADA